MERTIQPTFSFAADKNTWLSVLWEKMTMQRTPTHVVEYLDHTKGKKFPTGLASVMYAVQRYWTFLERGRARDGSVSVDEFCDPKPAGGGFLNTWQSVLNRWPGNRPLSSNGLKQHLPALFEQEHELRYALLAAFSAHCGLPTALFLLYSRLVSIEMQHLRDGLPWKVSRTELLEYLSACKEVLALAEQQIVNEKEGQPVFNHYFPERRDGRARPEKRRDKYMARARKLYGWSQVFSKKGAKFNPLSG